MALRYYVSTYRPPVCDNEECKNYGSVISIDTSYVPHAEIGNSWRTFCPKCGDGAGWTLNKVEWDPLIQIDEIKIDMTIPLGFQKDPISNGITKPYWKHDCEKCVWLGSHWMGDRYYDFYWCENGESEVSKGSGIIRDGNLPEDNESFPHITIADLNYHGYGNVYDVLQRLVMAHIEQ